MGQIDDHFAGRLSAAREQQMRAHLPECAPCRDRYARHLRLESIDPKALGFTERMRRGLGLDRPWWSGRLWGLGGMGAAVALTALLLVPRLGPSALDDGVRARGAGDAQLPLVLRLDDGTEIAGFRTNGPGAPAPATQQLPAQAELAFSYRNPGGWSHLMVFARDGTGRVFWFYPQWTDPGSNPSGVELRASPEQHELPAAVAHQLTPGPLSLCALLTRAPLSVGEVEATLNGAPPESLAGTGRAVVCSQAEVAE
jgi:hypothetical protein